MEILKGEFKNQAIEIDAEIIKKFDNEEPEFEFDDIDEPEILSTFEDIKNINGIFYIEFKNQVTEMPAFVRIFKYNSPNFSTQTTFRKKLFFNKEKITDGDILELISSFDGDILSSKQEFDNPSKRKSIIARSP